MRRLLFWAPRIIALLFAGFLAMFAADVFGEYHTFREIFLALMIHLIPTWLILAALAISWRWSWLGAVSFFGLAAYSAYRENNPTWLMIMTAPLAVIGLLFLLAALFGQHRRADQVPAASR